MRPARRTLQTILFTDIVGSTEPARTHEHHERSEHLRILQLEARGFRGVFATCGHEVNP